MIASLCRCCASASGPPFEYDLDFLIADNNPLDGFSEDDAGFRVLDARGRVGDQIVSR